MKVLVIEDSGPTRDLLVRALRSEQIAVETSSRLSTGLRQAMTGRHDVIVLDLMLPDGDGLDLCKRLRAEGVLTPVLCLTARGDVADRIQGLDSGADDYMKKPFALAELRARIRALARRQGLTAPARVAAGALVMDFTARKLHRRDSITATPSWNQRSPRASGRCWRRSWRSREGWWGAPISSRTSGTRPGVTNPTASTSS